MQAPDTGPHVEQCSAAEAHALLVSNRAAQLVDVRTKAEWNFVGTVDLEAVGKKPLLVEWQTWPRMNVSTDFVETLESMLTDMDVQKSAPLLFLCRSGVRSHAAAEACLRAGFQRCVNVEGGFEGPPDAARHRGGVRGWKAEGLPWVQS